VAECYIETRKDAKLVITFPDGQGFSIYFGSEFLRLPGAEDLLNRLTAAAGDFEQRRPTRQALEAVFLNLINEIAQAETWIRDTEAFEKARKALS
jgi:hypothetical protein